MNEQEFLQLWNDEKPIYEAWGRFIVDKICEGLSSSNKDLNSFVKVPAKHRLKADNSIIDKAFYRGKQYDNPYSSIEDKVGIRFVVLLVQDIQVISDIIEQVPDWDFDACKHFELDKEKDPLLFTYQSVHYILRPRNEIIINDEITIPVNTPCEVQIRTLLQHAHAELTHDAIYKAKTVVKPKVHRTVAKSMALIETTDEFFSQVTSQLNDGPVENNLIQNHLDDFYYKGTGLQPQNQKSGLIVLDVFEQFSDEGLVDKLGMFLTENSYIFDILKDRLPSREHAIYQQSVVLFIYWLLKNRRRRVMTDWPLSREILELLSSDIGVSITSD